jgi:hypothetical protein
VGSYGGQAVAFTLDSTGKLVAASQTSIDSFGYLPGSPSISANGTNNGIVWLLDRNANEMHAYDALTMATELWNSSQRSGGADSQRCLRRFYRWHRRCDGDPEHPDMDLRAQCHRLAEPALRPGSDARTAVSAGNFIAAPRIDSFTPDGGSAGIQVTITGENFMGATLVEMGGVHATFTVGSDSEITATVPPSFTTGMITVMTPGGKGTSSRSFRRQG